MVEIDPAARIGVYEYVAIKDYIAGLFDTRVDVVRRDRLKPHVRPAAVEDAIYAFCPSLYAALVERYPLSDRAAAEVSWRPRLRGIQG
jgi:hypothetical protein